MDAAAYLERIGLPADLGGFDEPVLRRLVAAHAASVPFENLRAHRGERISVQLDDILERIVARREGGVCYELNGGLGWLLTELGADVEVNAAQVLGDATAPDTGGLPMSHMTLIVTLPGGTDAFLVDVGFGGETILRDVPADGETVTTTQGSAYRIDRRPRRLEDFEGLAWWHSTSPGSRFMTGLIVSSTRPEGIVTLFGRDEGAGADWFFRDGRDADFASDAGDSGATSTSSTSSTTSTAPRPVSREAAQSIAAETFGLTAPLPRGVIRYAPVVA